MVGGHDAAAVFVWDLDETLIIFQTLLDGRYVQHFDGFKDSAKAVGLGRRWERLILEVCDDYFFYNQVKTAGSIAHSSTCLSLLWSESYRIMLVGEL